MDNIEILDEKDVLAGLLPKFDKKLRGVHSQDWHKKNLSFLENFYDALHLESRNLSPHFHEILLDKNLQFYQYLK